MRKQFLQVVCLVSVLFSQLSSFCQTVPVGNIWAEETYRRAQISGTANQNLSFSLRPLFLSSILRDSFLTTNDTLYNIYQTFAHPVNESRSILLLPASLTQQYNSHHPFGWNDGSMIPSKGYQMQISAGVYSQLGPLSLQLRPELVYAQNNRFPVFPAAHNDTLWRSYYYIHNRIDNPEQFGTGSFVRLFPGQSSLRFNYKKMSVGVSTENLWWGPGVRNSLLMSNTAPGFKHISFNTTSPVTSKIGSFEWQLISGILKNSGIPPLDTNRTFDGQKLYDPKPNVNRYLNGLIIVWQPKWTKGLHLGFSRVFYQYTNNLASSFNGYLPVFSTFFKSKSRDENAFGRDQLLSVFFRLVMPESKAEVYAEYGRNDHSRDFLDLVLEPEHARAYILGVKKIFDAGKKNDLELFMEMTHLQNPSTRNLRALEGWYTHYQVRHGYTNEGQVLGAGIGPGGSSQTVGLNWFTGWKKTGFQLERIVRNNDFYYEAFESQKDWGRHWVDFALSFNRSWLKKKMMYSANLSFVNSVNYQWIRNYEKLNVNAALSMSYLF